MVNLNSFCSNLREERIQCVRERENEGKKYIEYKLYVIMKVYPNKIAKWVRKNFQNFFWYGGPLGWRGNIELWIS